MLFSNTPAGGWSLSTLSVMGGVHGPLDPLINLLHANLLQRQAIL